MIFTLFELWQTFKKKKKGEEKTHLPLKSVDFHTVDNNLN